MKTYAGGCHCGRFKIEFSTDHAPSDFTPRADGCGFCRRHNAAAIADAEGRLLVRRPADAPKPYQFGLKITDFHVCDRCGVWVAATWRDGDGKVYGVVNVPALDDRGQFAVTPVDVDFDHEDITAREARRRRSWTPATIA